MARLLALGRSMILAEQAVAAGPGTAALLDEAEKPRKPGKPRK